MTAPQGRPNRVAANVKKKIVVLAAALNRLRKKGDRAQYSSMRLG
jgi:hypothetical protein